LRQVLGAKCRRFAENHDWDLVAKKIDSVLTEIVEKEALVNAKYWSPTRKKLDLSFENSQYSVLDAGSGTGWLSTEHAKRLKRVVAIEAAQDRAEISKSHHTFEVCKANTEVLPLRDGVFDTVVCYDVLEHVPNYSEAIHEFRRVLKSKGMLIIAVPNAKGSYTLLHDRLMYFRKKALKTDLRLDHINHFEHATLLSQLNSQGFAACSTTNIEFLSPIFYVFRRSKIVSILSELDTRLARKLPSSVVSEWVIKCQK
jgi:ubiquinone/menaquinone biosynthesis C-methylase UbiE